MNKHIAYSKYIIKHKWYVFLECCKLGIPLAGVTHDLSKFMPDEWGPYAMSFYGPQPRTQETKLAFDEAWLNHQHRNPHHWQHWVLREDSGKVKLVLMPERYMREMLADWRGAGRAINGKDNTAEWYLKNASNIQLHVLTRLWIEGQLGVNTQAAVPL